MSRFSRKNIIMRKAPSEMMNPRMVDIRSGAVVKEVMPSIPRLKRLAKLKEDLPTTRSPRSNRISFFLKPIQQNMPFV